jgi:hypothetical protein
MKETPSENIFLEMREAATKIWNTYDNEFGYVTEKLHYINSLKNIGDNAMVFYRMFDFVNQNTFNQIVSDEVLEYIKNNK